MNSSSSSPQTYQAEPASPGKPGRFPVWLISLVFVGTLIGFLLVTGRSEISRWHFAAARNAIEDARYEDAITSVEKGLKWNPESMGLVRIRAMANLELENFEACLEDYDLLIEHAEQDGETNESDMAPRMAKAAVLQKIDRYPEVIELCDEVVEFRREQYQLRNDSESQYEYATSLNNRAYFEAQAWVIDKDSVDIRESLGDIRLAVKLRIKEDPILIDTLGYLLLLNGDAEEALTELNKAVELTRNENAIRRKRIVREMQRVVDQRPYQELLESVDENLAVILHHRGEALIATGSEEEGKADIEEAVGLGYDREAGVW